MRKEKIYRFCPICGGPFEKKIITADEPKRLVCKKCNFVFYLDPKVVACTIAETDKGVVLQKRMKNPGRGKWVLPGGFVDRGETLEDAAVREFFEETGLHVHINHLIGVYSYPGEVNIMAVYQGDVTGGIITPCHESMDIGEFLKSHLPWDQLAFETTRKALVKYTGVTPIN